MTLYENTITRNTSGFEENENILSAYDEILIEEVINKYELNEDSWLNAAKKVVKDHQYIHINPKNNKISDDKKSGFVILDAVTANMLVQISDALGSVNKEKFTKLPLMKAIDLGWKLVKK